MMGVHDRLSVLELHLLTCWGGGHCDLLVLLVLLPSLAAADANHNDRDDDGDWNYNKENHETSCETM